MMESIEQHKQGVILLQIARQAINQTLRVSHPAVKLESDMDWLYLPGATFVTLMQHGELRGCIGSLQACDPLIEDVNRNAVSAALRDPRFMPLMADELDSVRVEMSLLSGLQPVNFTSESDALAQLRSAIDGLVLEYGAHRSTFLPQVWETLPDPVQFLAKLKSKARLPESFWDEEIRLSRYTVSKWRETDQEQEVAYG